MENINDLIEQIREYDDKLKEIFITRLSLLEKIILHEQYDETLTNNIKFAYEYNYLKNNISNIDKIYKYKKLVETINDTEKKCGKDINEIEKVCYQGLPFSYSESAAKALFKPKTLINKNTFEDVFKSVYEDECDIGVVPIENSTAGYINDVYDLLLKYDLYINYTYNKKIDHCLASTKNSCIDDITEVYSHPQALMQCKDYIEKHNFRAVNEANTAVAAQKIEHINKTSAACICSTEAAEYYGLKILEKEINHKENYTRFGAISKYLSTDKNHNRISIVFQAPHTVGSLDNVLSIFSFYKINLSSIYSRPDLKSPWKYLFYLDFEGSILSDEVKAILYQLKIELPFMKILGSYKI